LTWGYAGNLQTLRLLNCSRSIANGRRPVEPIEMLGVAGVVAVAWALGRASERSESGAAPPGEQIAAAGTRLSRNAAFGIAAIGSRALMFSAAAIAAGGSLVARGVGAGADMAVTAGEVASRTVRRVAPGSGRETPRALESGNESTPLVEETDSGIVVPVDANTTV
jgi:hypothetical protein